MANDIYKLGFDASEVMKGLQEIRKQMGDLGSNVKIFSGVDKEFENLKKIINELQAAAQLRGTEKGGKQFNKLLDDMVISAAKVSNELQRIGTNADGTFKFTAVQQGSAKLKDIKTQISALQSELKDFKSDMVDTVKALDMDVNQAKAIKNEQEMIALLEEEYKKRKNIYEAEQNAIRAKNSTSAKVKAVKIGDIESYKDPKDKNAETVTKITRPIAQNATSLINQGLQEGISKAKTFEETWEIITGKLQQAGIKLKENNSIQEDARTTYNATNGLIDAGIAKLTNQRSAMEQIKIVGEDNKEVFSKQAKDLIEMSTEIGKTTSEIEQLKNAQKTEKDETNAATEAAKKQAQTLVQGAQEATVKTTQLAENEKRVTDSLVEQTQQQNRLNESIKRMSTWIANVLSLTNAWRKFNQIVRQTFTDVQKLDKAFASIAMVTDKTVEGLWATYDDYADMANRLGQTTESAIQASALFYQQGLDTAEALELTEQTMKLATLAGADFSTATQQMTAALRGFHMEMEEGSRVTDVYSELAAHAAADVNGIAYAMSKTASIASSAGMDFETTAAFITNMIETTQEAPENIGTAMKTIIARFTELKENVSEADSEFDDLDYNKVDKALKSVGINIKDAQGQFRNLDDVFLELSAKWDTLDRNTQRYIATIAAGSRQQSRFIAMMEDYDRTMELVETAQDSAGRSSEQFAKYQDTVEYKLNQLKNAWEQLRVTMINSNVFKTVIDQATDFVKKISKIDFKKLIAFGPIIIPMVKNFIKIFTQGIQNSATNFQNIGKAIGQKISNGFNSVGQRAVTQFPEYWANAAKKAAAKIDEINTKLNGLSQRKIQIQIEKEAATANLQQLEIELQKAEREYQDFIVSGEQDEIKKDKLSSTYAALNQEVIKARSNLNSLGNEEIENVNQTNQLKNKVDETTASLGRYQQKEEQTKQATAQMSAAVSSNLQLVASATASVFMAIAAGADAETALKGLLVSMGAQLASLIAQLASAAIAAKIEGTAIGKGVGDGINAGLASTGVGLIIVAIGMAIAGIGLAITALVKKWKDTHKTIEDQLTDSKKALEEIERQKDEDKNSSDESKKKLDDTEKMINRYDELSHKLVKTTEEQEEWNELIKNINEEFPEIVTSYDEANNKIKLQRELWEDILNIQKEIAKDEAEQAALSNAAYLGQKKRTSYLEYQNSINDAKKAYGLAETQTINRNFKNQLNSEFSNPFNLNKTAKEKFQIAADKQGVDVNKLATAFGFDTTDGDWETFYAKIENINSDGWDEVQKKIDQIEAKAKSTYETEQKYYQELQKENISSTLQAKGQSKAVADFIASGVAGKTTTAYNLKSAAESNSLMVGAEKLVSKGAAMPFIGKYAGAATVGANIALYAQGNDAQTWDELDSKQIKILRGIYGQALDAEEWKKKKKNILDDEDFIAMYTEAATELYQNELADALEKGLDELSKKQIEDFAENYDTMTKEEIEEVKKELTNSLSKDLNEEERKNAEDAIAATINGPLEELRKAKEEIAEKIDTDANHFADWTLEQLNAYDSIIQNAIDKFGTGVGKAYGKDIDSLFSAQGLRPEQINQALNAINWDSASASTWKDFRESAIEQLREIGVPGAEAFFDQWAEYEKKWGNLTLSITNEEELTEYLEKVDEQIEKITSSRGDIAELNAKLRAGTKLNIDDYDKYAKVIKELGLEVSDYLKIDQSGNIVANTEKLKNLYKDMYQQQIDDLELQKAALDDEEKQRKETLKTQRDANIAEINQTTYCKQTAAAEKELLAIKYEQLAVDEERAGNHYEASRYKQNANIIRNQYKKEFAESQKLRDEAIKAEKERYRENLLATSEWRVEAEEELAEKIKELKARMAADTAQYTQEEIDNYNDLIEKTEEAADKAEEAADKVADAWEKVADAQEKVNEALEKIKEKEQDVIDKTNELNKILYGDELHKNKLDAMYNYSTALDAITTKTSRAKSSLESYSGKEDVSALMRTYMQGTHAEVVNRGAQNEVIAASIRNYEQVLSSKLAQEISSMNAAHGSHMSTNISDYVYKNGDVTAVNFQALNAAQLPDEISDYVEECVETINNLQKQIDDNTEAIKQKEKEIRDMRKNALQRRVNLEKEVADVLKKQAEDEVKTQKDKYDALKDADDDYLNALEEAINKERELRERNKEWNDLATKEKKLSLMQRDTSGANAKEVMSLEQDVQDTRENLLDKTIDDIIKGMKEMYELQQESREKELEYQEAMMESTEWIKQATAIIDGWTTSDDMVTWFIEHATEEYTEGSAAVQELMRMGWEDTGNQMVADNEILSQDMSDLAIATHEEISQTVIETSETLTEQADFSLQSIVASAEDAIAKGEQALEDAIREVQNARDDYRDAIKELEEAEAAARQAEEDAKKAQQDAEEERLAAAAANGAGSNGAWAWNNSVNSSNASTGTVASYDDNKQHAIDDIAHKLDSGYLTASQAEDALNNLGLSTRFRVQYNYGKGKNEILKYATGGLVDYTGPAWVDGTPDEPEAFLSAEDTKRIGQAAELLSSLPFFGGGSINNSVNNGDSLIEVHINIENISSDVDLDNALDKMKNAIWEAANPAGSSVILSK